MVMKVKANELKQFIKKTTASGLITDCKLSFKSDGLHMIHKDSAGVVLIAGVLDKKVFNQYEEMEISIKNSATLISVLSTFKDNLINIVQENNMVKIMDENGGIELATAEQVECVLEGVPKLEYNNTLIMKKSMIDTIMQRNNIINSDEIQVNVQDKKLNLTIGKETDKANVSEITNFEENLKVDFDLNYFKKLSEQMDTIVDLSLSEEHPSKFVEKSDKYTIQYYLTAITESE